MLKFNPDTNVIFDNEEAAVAPIREITRDDIPDLIANGAGVDPSANVGEQTSSPAQTDGDAQAAQDPAVSATGSDTDADVGKPVDTSSISPAASSSESTAAADEGKAADTAATSDSQSVDVSPAVISDAQADPGGAGAADLNPTPAAPNLDAQVPASVSSDAVPLDVGGAADAEAGGAEAGESDAALSASQIGSGSDEHPLTIIGEIEALVRMVGNAAVHEYQRLIQRLADLKNHPTIKDGE
ncbi:hypothetical protein [Caballeronia sp. LZ028]|uniref:hypothetical protein n=1 Tax=Caballeronia sp. LZ028 TaxID=3038563 RepID=UPI002864B290|nr:hypothetical protein [Caballeronia sp. LZ028]MDR5765025.1 hypothetical protein [Caballeronia sp. LZ028]